MINRFLLVITTIITMILVSSFSCKNFKKDQPLFYMSVDTVKHDTVKVDSTLIDSLIIEKEGDYNYKLYKSKGYATHYANRFNGRRTASGERFDNNKLTAAHRKLPFGTKVRVTNLANGRTIIVKINDRGPHVKGREIDLSNKAFMYLASKKARGVMPVKIEIAIKK